ncbi:NUDIX hydrolase [Sphaerisporangium perillae]|uniref:NUDIX hydrolase n=1 Tax=Sphaerisporangium perillae TaxID=2935860 RepID=UPI002010265E|nr:NUDIX domain-containing protein [Sphaerisporangium perillae]
MAAPDGVEVVDPLVEALAAYRPSTALEAADLERARALPAAGDPWGRSTALHATVSALIVHPPTRRVLLRWHARQRAWLQVGGHADPGETDPLAIALRESREETGLGDLTPWPDPSRASIAHIVVVPVTAGAREPAHEHADLRFLLATATPDAARPENPEAPLRWLSVQEARAATTEANVRETLARVARLFGRHLS